MTVPTNTDGGLCVLEVHWTFAAGECIHPNHGPGPTLTCAMHLYHIVFAPALCTYIIYLYHTVLALEPYTRTNLNHTPVTYVGAPVPVYLCSSCSYL